MHGGDLIQVENRLWVLTAPTGLPIYDFDFSHFLTCKHPWQRPDSIQAVARVGVWGDYESRYNDLLREGIALVHSPEEHLRCSELPHWYPLLAGLTPKSIWFSQIPSSADVAATLGWPIFLKGHRQTSRHNRALSIVDGPESFHRAMEIFKDDPILRWQGIVCREYVQLRPVEDPNPDRIPSSFEFRTFWWRGQLVGCGRYWWEGKDYKLDTQERRAAIEVAAEAAKRVSVRFVVVDIAQTAGGQWIVIECNDGQESGYAGIAPLAMWQKIIAIEKDISVDRSG